LSRTLPNRHYLRARLRDVVSELESLVHAERRPLDTLLVSAPVGRIGWQEARDLEYRPAKMGERFGPPGSSYWFRLETTVADDWAGRRIDLLWVALGEATLWCDGRSLQGLNSGRDQDRVDAMLEERAESGQRLSLQIEMAVSSAFGIAEFGTEYEPVRLDECALVAVDEEAYDLWLDVLVLAQLEAELDDDPDPALAGVLREGLNRFVSTWQADARDTWPAARATLVPLLSLRNGDVTFELSAVGHGHLDTAWHWPIAETIRKCTRTFSSQLRYMDAYPEYLFVCSQAQHYAWMKEHNPDLYTRIRQAVAEKRFVPVGATWVEPDCNLPSGESLVRQFLHGQRFFQQEFGLHCHEFWSPDSFGYGNQLPQIMRLAGIERFVECKLSWPGEPLVTRQHHHAYIWRGLDGSEVLAHTPFNAELGLDVAALREAARAMAEDAQHTRSRLVLFGYGDGGGGPTPTMIEILRRTADLAGVPRVRIEPPQALYAELSADAPGLPIVEGELYYPYHQGVYTSQAATKAGNRRGEIALHDAELLAAIAGQLGLTVYPAAELKRLWELLLLNQFHDILPGTSIGLVAQEAERDLAEVAGLAAGIRDAALATFPSNNEGRTPFNPTPFPRRGVCEAPTGELVFVDTPGYGFGTESTTAHDDLVVHEHGARIVIENCHLRAVLDDGQLVSLVERESGREALAATGNVLTLHRDDPAPLDEWNVDAWNIDPAHLETGVACHLTVESITKGQLRAEVVLAGPIGAGSSCRQVVRLDAGARSLAFHTSLDWRERHTILKTKFPFNVHAPRATFESAFGTTERPTHRSTPQDAVQYEVPGHRFVDLSQHDFGVALLTDAKYGYSAERHTIAISLLRGPTHPDPDCDLGYHSFAYAVMPHSYGWREAAVLHEAAHFNAPILWKDGAVEMGSLASVDGTLVLDTVKAAEDGDGLVLRLYEAYGGSGTANVHLAVPAASYELCDLLECPVGDAEPAHGGIKLHYRPHQILSVRVR
jgi:alpha-mannosidase